MKKIGSILLVLVALFGMIICAKEYNHKEQNKREEIAKEESVVLVQVKEDAVLEDNVFSFGQLTFTLPEAGEAEIVELGNGVEAVCLRSLGDEYEFPREIYFRHYTADWQGGSEYMLINALMDLIGTDEMICRHKNLYAGELGLLIDAGYRSYNIIVRNQDIYIAEEISVYSDFSISDRYRDDIVFWKDTGAVATLYGVGDAYYARLAEPGKKEFFLVGEDYRLNVFEQGFFEEPIQDMICAESGMSIELCGDINFDNYPDMYWSSAKRYYLYDPESGMFEKAHCQEIIENFLYTLVKYPQQQTIWSHDTDYMDDYPYNIKTEIEGLWKWEGNRLKLVRECVLSYKEDSLCLTIKEGEEILLEVTVDKEEWEQDENMLRSYYEQFYEGYVPKEAYYLEHSAEGETEYIPQELVDIIVESMKNGTELETLKAMVCDRKMTEEECVEAAYSNDAIRWEVEMASEVGSYIMVVTDGDNDGITDIGMESYGGGSGGFTDFVFYKGQSDGTYVLTSSYPHVMEEFAFISYEGKQYLCRTLFDYNKKQVNGFDLFYYEDGKRVENVWLELIPQEYEIAITKEPQGVYADYVKESLSPEKCLKYQEMVEEFETITGNAERDSWICDLNNDGEDEEYNKSIWIPSNMGTYSCLTFDCENLPEVIDMIYHGETNGIPMMMWVDTVDGKNIINVLHRTDIYDFFIVGYLIEGSDYEKLYCIEGTAECDVYEYRFSLNAGEHTEF